MRSLPDHEELLTPAEVARAFSVDPKTVSRWAKDGKLRAVRTPGGHRRFSAAQVYELLGQLAPETAR